MTTHQLIAIDKWLKRITIFIGLAIMTWLAVEDQTPFWALLFSGCLLMLAGAASLLHLQKNRNTTWWRLLFVGLLGGLAVAPIAILLMAVKTGIHGHTSPDYSAKQILWVIRSTPIWLISGSALGAGIGILIGLLSSSGSRSTVNENG